MDESIVPVLGPIIAMFFFALLVACGALIVGKLFGPAKYEKAKYDTYECGIEAQGSAHNRISVKYYLVAILFLLFDLEAAILIPVAIAWPQLKTVGFVSLGLTGFFLLYFVLSIWFEFRMKALEWERGYE